MIRENARFSKMPFSAKVQDVARCLHGRVVDRLSRAIGQGIALGMTPNAIHGIEFGSGGGQETDFHFQLPRQILA